MKKNISTQLIDETIMDFIKEYVQKIYDKYPKLTITYEYRPMSETYFININDNEIYYSDEFKELECEIYMKWFEMENFLDKSICLLTTNSLIQLNDPVILNPKPLQLNLKKEWFDMILNEKKEEYRGIKESMISLLFNWKKHPSFKRKDFVEELKGGNLNLLTDYLKPFKTIMFSNGYAKNRKQIEIEFLGIEVKTGNVKWGAKKDVLYLTLKLGKIIK